MRKLSKYVEYIQTLFYKKAHEKKIKYKNTTIKYIFQKNSTSKSLIVVFSACTRVGIPARYNYMRTLDVAKSNKLFILDDYGQDHRGGYYLGHYPDFEFEQATVYLLNQVIKNNEIEKCYFVGSSKGAYAALNFGLQLSSSKIGCEIIVGAPQYYLGNYLSAPANKTTLNSILGTDISDQDAINVLNNYLGNVIKKYSKGCKSPIYIHYSTNEHTYKEHIADLIKDLKRYNYDLHEDIGSYTEHWDVSIYYPKYLLAVLKKNAPEMF